MLKYFFDINEAEKNKKLFAIFKIEKDTYFKEQGKYPVIFISMKDIKGNNFESLKKSVMNCLSDLYVDIVF